MFQPLELNYSRTVGVLQYIPGPQVRLQSIAINRYKTEVREKYLEYLSQLCDSILNFTIFFAAIATNSLLTTDWKSVVAAQYAWRGSICLINSAFFILGAKLITSAEKLRRILSHSNISLDLVIYFVMLLLIVSSILVFVAISMTINVALCLQLSDEAVNLLSTADCSGGSISTILISGIIGIIVGIILVAHSFEALDDSVEHRRHIQAQANAPVQQVAFSQPLQDFH